MASCTVIFARIANKQTNELNYVIYRCSGLLNIRTMGQSNILLNTLFLFFHFSQIYILMIVCNKVVNLRMFYNLILRVHIKILERFCN